MARSLSLFASFIALILALLVEQRKVPKLEIITNDEINHEKSIKIGNSPQESRHKWFRVKVKNNPFPRYVSWLLPRNTAMNCHAIIEFYQAGENEPKFKMEGRWASTLELPLDDRTKAFQRSLYPDTVNIPARDSEILDIIMKEENDKNAYGWNNLSYSHNWKVPGFDLSPGLYDVRITINTLNGNKFTEILKLNVSDNIDGTNIKS